MELRCTTLEGLDEVAIALLREKKEARIFTLQGEMGAGKTTFMARIAACLRSNDPVSSPTYSLVNEYHCRDGKIIYHFDLYRIKSEAEALDIGLEEYLYSGNYCFIEWPERAEGLIPDEKVSVFIRREGDIRLFSF